MTKARSKPPASKWVGFATSSTKRKLSLLPAETLRICG